LPCQITAVLEERGCRGGSPRGETIEGFRVTAHPDFPYRGLPQRMTAHPECRGRFREILTHPDL
jgi:hypothetical protein